MADRFPCALWLSWLIWLALAGTSLSFGFVWDDIPIIQGPVINDLSQLPAVFTHRTLYVSAHDGALGHGGLQTYRPLTVATLMIDAALYGSAAWGFHLTSLLLHLLNAWIVLNLTWKLAPDAPAWVPAAAATWFAVIPYLVEAYVWINGRSDVLATLFGAMLVLSYLRALAATSFGHRVAWGAACTALALLCLLSKETGVAWLVGLVVLPVQASWRRRGGVLAAVACGFATYAALRLSALEGMHISSDSQALRALWISAYVVLDALSEVFVPRYTSVRFLEFEMRSVGTAWLATSWLVLGAMLLATWRGRHRWPGVFFGFVTAVVSLLPVALIATMQWPGFGRYVYSAAAALAPGVAMLAAELSAVVKERASRLAAGAAPYVAAAYLTMLSGVSFVSAQPFSSERGLYESWVAGTPEQPHGYRWLGLTFMEEKRYAEAFDALERARQLDPKDTALPSSQINCLQALGQQQRAAEFADKVAWEYENPYLHLLALVNLADKDSARARLHVRRCLELQPDFPQCQFWQKRLVAPSASDAAHH